MSVRISLTGDLLAYKSLLLRSRSGNVFDFSDVFSRAASLFQDSDYVVGNLETPLAGEKERFTQMDMSFNTPDQFVFDANRIGFDMFTTANNHCLDRGKLGLERTLAVLDSAGIDHTGTFSSINDSRFFVKEVKGIRFAFISYTYDTNPNVNGFEIGEDNRYLVNLTKSPGPPYKRKWFKSLLLNFFYMFPSSLQKKIHPLYPDHPYPDCVGEEEISSPRNESWIRDMKQTIADARKVSDVVIFCLHSGGQFNSTLGEYTNYLIKTIKDCNVSALIVNHPHCVLGSEWNKDNSFTAYSLGNFSFTPNEGYYIEGVLADYGIVLHLDFDRDRKQLEDVWFSVIKNIRTADGKERVVPVFDLYHDLSTEGEIKQLIKENSSVINRFLGTNKEYGVRPFYRYSDCLVN